MITFNMYIPIKDHIVLRHSCDAKINHPRLATEDSAIMVMNFFVLYCEIVPTTMLMMAKANANHLLNVDIRKMGRIFWVVINKAPPFRGRRFLTLINH